MEIIENEKIFQFNDYTITLNISTKTIKTTISLDIFPEDTHPKEYFRFCEHLSDFLHNQIVDIWNNYNETKYNEKKIKLFQLGEKID